MASTTLAITISVDSRSHSLFTCRVRLKFVGRSKFSRISVMSTSAGMVCELHESKCSGSESEEEIRTNRSLNNERLIDDYKH